MTTTDPRPLVVHVVHRFGVGGLENGVANLLNGLPEFRHAVLALTVCDPAVCRRVARDDVEFISLDKPPGHGWRVFGRAYRLFRSLAPAIVHTRNLAALEMQLPAWIGAVPVRIHGEHGRDVTDPDGKNRVYRLTRRLYGPFVTEYVAVSRDLEHYLTSIGVAAARVHRICNGVDERKFAPLARDAAAPGGPCRIGTVGRLQEIKDQRTLVAAVAHLVAMRPDLRTRIAVEIVGDGPCRAELERDIAARGLQDVIALLGERSAIAELMRTLDIFVLPSRAEGISNTILEAMATGLPVVATAVGGTQELVADGATGTLVAAADPEAMARAVARYVDSAELRRRHGAAARKRVEAEFALSGMIEQYRQLYRGVLQRVGAGRRTLV